MPYWLTKLLGRADGPALTRCGVCNKTFAKADGQRATGVPGLVCSDACVVEGMESRAW